MSGRAIKKGNPKAAQMQNKMKMKRKKGSMGSLLREIMLKQQGNQTAAKAPEAGQTCPTCGRKV